MNKGGFKDLEARAATGMAARRISQADAPFYTAGWASPPVSCNMVQHAV
jgi:hypothetical protein